MTRIRNILNSMQIRKKYAVKTGKGASRQVACKNRDLTMQFSCVTFDSSILLKAETPDQTFEWKLAFRSGRRAGGASGARLATQVICKAKSRFLHVSPLGAEYGSSLRQAVFSI
jgi:hypothetical protein